MQDKENFSVFNISNADSARFRRIVIDVMSEACAIPSDDEDIYKGIGTLGEKQMHAAIKRFICPDTSCHEVKIDGSSGCISQSKNDEDKQKTRRFVADILTGNNIYEIQTGSFSPLKNKIQWIIDNTTYNLTVIHPIAETKWISIINSKTREIESRKRSPQKGSIRDIASDLYFLTDFISSPRFSLVILIIEAEQYKKNLQSDKRKRPRYQKYEMIPISLIRAYIFKDRKDYRIFIPDDLPEKFTVRDYSKAAKIYGIDAYSIVKTLCSIGLLEPCGNIGRAAAYKIKDRNPN